MSRRITLFASHGVQPLDITGPASVFAQANEILGTDHYQIELVSPEGGLIRSFSGIPLLTTAHRDLPVSEIDALLLAGHKPQGTRDLVSDEASRLWFTDARLRSHRWGSVCGGSYILAAWGLVQGRHVATHWRTVQRLSDEFPDVDVNPDALFVTDRDLWTSAGVTAGIDMALAMIEADHGADLAAQIARHLVVYMRRPGSQSQFSEPLRHQTLAATPYDHVMTWAKANLGSSLNVDALADQAGQSIRTFQRRFSETTGKTPAAFVEDLRLDRAKALLSCDVPLKSVADQVGYKSSSQLNLVFRRRFGIAPSIWKAMHR